MIKRYFIKNCDCVDPKLPTSIKSPTLKGSWERAQAGILHWEGNVCGRKLYYPTVICKALSTITLTRNGYSRLGLPSVCSSIIREEH